MRSEIESGLSSELGVLPKVLILSEFVTRLRKVNKA